MQIVEEKTLLFLYKRCPDGYLCAFFAEMGCLIFAHQVLGWKSFKLSLNLKISQGLSLGTGAIS